MTHPNLLELEASAAGDASPGVEEHVGGCDACKAFVARAKSLPARFSMDRLLADARKREQRKRLVVVAAGAIPLAAAAVGLLFLRAPATMGAGRADTIATPSVAVAQNEPDTTFKGGVQVAVVRDRVGSQDRFVANVRVKPGDRLRIEVALDRSQAILGGVLGDDGSWVELMPEAVRAAGTHFSEKSVRIDATPSNGTILVGAPEDVRRARATKQLDTVRALHVAWEGP